MDDWKMTLFLVGMAALLLGVYLWNYRTRKRLEVKMFGTRENPDRNLRHFPWTSRITLKSPLTEEQLGQLERRLNRTEGIFAEGIPGEKEICVHMRQPFSEKALRSLVSEAGCEFGEMTEAKMES